MILNLPKLGLVQFDDNLSSEELNQQLATLSQKYGFKFEQPERGLGTLLGHGAMRGTKQLGSALFDVLPAMGASALGFEDYAKKQLLEAADTQAEIERNYPAQFKSYTEIGSPYEALQYGAETLGELAPTALGAMIPGGIAGGIGRAAATRGALAAAESVGPLSLAGREAAQVAAKKAGEEAGRTAMYGGLFLGSFAQNAPEVFENIYEKTGKLEPLVSGLAGGVMGLLDSVVPARVLNSFGGFGKLKMAEKLVKDSGAAPSVWKAIGKEAATSAVSEGLTESAQEAISVAAEEYAGSLKGLLDPESIQRYKESFVKGAVGGAGFGAIGGYGKGTAEKRAALDAGDKLARELSERQQEIQKTREEMRARGETTATPEQILAGEERVVEGEVVHDETRQQEIDAFLAQLQAEAEAEAARQVPTEGAQDVTRLDTEAGGAGVGVVGEGVSGAAPTPVESIERGRVDVAGGDVSQLTGREEAQFGALETQAPAAQAAPAPTAAKKTFEVTMSYPRDMFMEDRKYVVEAANKAEANKIARNIASENVQLMGRNTFKAKEIEAAPTPTAAQPEAAPTAPKELPLIESVKGTFTPEQRRLVEVGDLKGSLQNLAEQAKGPMNLGSVFSPARRETASILQRMLSADTKTKLVLGPTDNNRPGSFNPVTNTITLNPETGLNPHTILHETSHAQLSHTLDNPSHPVTKEVTNLYNQMKASSEGTYGATNVQEFAAEAWGNPEFREHLRQFKPTGEKLNGWRRFVNAVRRLFGFKPRYETAFDSLDTLLNQIISPAPESRAGETLFAASTEDPDIAKKVFGPSGYVDSAMKAVPSVMTPARREAVWKTLEKLALPARALVYKGLTATQLGEVGRKYFGENSTTFARLLNEQEGYKEVLREKTEPFHDRMTKHFNASPERHAVLSDLINQVTLNDVAPYSIGVDATGAKKVPTRYIKEGKEQVWRDLNAKFEQSLTPEEQQLLRDNFETHRALTNELDKSLAINIKESVGDRDRAISVYNKIKQELAQFKIDNYSPLFREPTGYRLSYNINGEPKVERFKTQTERSMAEERLAAQGATDFEATSNIEQFTARTVPDNTMLSSIMNIMKDAGAKEEDLTKLVQLIVSAYPETSVLKRRQKRSGIGGYINDNAAYVFDRVASSTINQIATTRYRQRLMNALQGMEQDQKKLRGDASEDAKTMFNDFNGRFDYAANPTIAGWAQFASSSAFYFELAGNVSSAVVQVATVPTIVLPTLGGKYGWAASIGALKNALNLYTKSGTTREVTDLTGNKNVQKAMLSVENLTSTGDKEAAKYTDLIEALKGYGLLTNSTARDALRSENTNDSGFGGVNKLQRVTSLWGSFLFHHTERMSREMTAIATYDLEMERLKKTKMPDSERQAKAIQEAIRITERAHGASNTITGPSLGQSNLGKVAMVFKRFALAQYYMLFDTIFRALPVKNASPDVIEDIKAARRQLVGIYGMAAMFAGVKGMPLYWVAALAYNALRDDDDDDFDALMRRYLHDLAYKGPVNYITKLSIADRVGWNDLIFRENKADRAGTSAVTQHLEAMLGAPLSIAKNFEKGLKLVGEGNFYRGTEYMLPAAVRNVLKGLRYGQEGANTLRGDPVMGEISGYNAAMQVLGFAPAELMKQYEENAYLTGKQKAITGKEQNLLKQYYVAFRQNDFDRANELREKLFELGDKYPELGINEAMLNKSVKARDRISEKLYHGVQLNEKLRARLEGARSAVYD